MGIQRNPIQKGGSRAWDVRLHGKLIDTVWFLRSMTADDVKRSLVGHDGYDSSISVSRPRNKGLPRRKSEGESEAGRYDFSNPKGGHMKRRKGRRKHKTGRRSRGLSGLFGRGIGSLAVVALAGYMLYSYSKKA